MVQGSSGAVRALVDDFTSGTALASNSAYTHPREGGGTMDTLRERLHHLLNPLHLYCRLREAGLCDAVARRMSRAYERALYRRLLA